MQKFRHKPTEIIVKRFYNNKEEVKKFLEENNETYCRDYWWRFTRIKNNTLLEVLRFLPESGVCSSIGISHGDYIGRDEYGNITTYLQEEIEEFYDEVHNGTKE